jgi:hypothetical protein
LNNKNIEKTKNLRKYEGTFTSGNGRAVIWLNCEGGF